jgi:CRP/FNR family cyclic AMP-dependent transcriptional regulator
VVFREGDPGDTLYVILGGAVKVYRTDKQQQKIQLATLKGGDYFGELALIDGEPRSAGVSTIAPCRFCLIGRRDFLTLVSKSPWMLAELLVALSTIIRHSSERVSG